MTTLLSEIHFWTAQEDVIIKNTDYASFKYYLKKDLKDSIYNQAKKEYCEKNGILYFINNKRPEKLREHLKELEEYLVHNKIVCYNWDENKLKLLLSTGLIVQLVVNLKTGDLASITFEKQLSLKLQVNIICDGVIFGSQVICICNDGHVLGFGGPWKDGWILEGGPRRHLNCHGEWLAVWGKAGTEHPQPWSPLAKDHQRANLHLYRIGLRDPELLAYKKTDGEPLLVVISKFSSKTLILVEQKVTQKGAVSVEVNNFELIGNALGRVSVTSVPLQTQVSCSALSADESRLLIGCIDGSLALLDRNRGSTRTVKCAFIPTMATWNMEGVFVAIANERGLLQYYDTALNCVKCQFSTEDCTPTTLIDLSGYFSSRFSIVSINWGPKDIIIAAEQGPLAVLTHLKDSLNFKAVAQRYVYHGKTEKAIKLLLSWDFNDKSFFVLQKIVAHLMKGPLTEEVAQHLQNALGSFHSPPVPLPSQIRHKFGHQVFSLTRRFFHQLVRANMFETAFLLAVDIGHHDLFMDLHYIAVKVGETEMAAAARAQASALLSRCSSEASNCSRSSCSQCSGSECDSCSTEDETAHPPDRDINSSSHKSDSYHLSQPPDILSSENILTTDFNQPIPTTYKTLEKDRRQQTERPSDLDDISENMLTTDFNQPNPTTYQTNEKEEYERRVGGSDLGNLKFGPKGTYVKAPQVPSSFTKLSQTAAPVIPPLPFHSALGIPYIQQYTETISTQNRSVSTSNLNYFERNLNHTSAFSAFNINNVGLPNVTSKDHSVSTSKLVPPPLPMVTTTTPSYLNSTPFYSSNNYDRYSTSTSFSNNNPFANALQPNDYPTTDFPHTNQPNDYLTNRLGTTDIDFSASTSNLSKKHQPKVKFSDTVTAFIVPEIKRPVRPAPPPHVTDPQRELAESLPLCHPNEDYLKDFTPVRSEEPQQKDNERPPKIKVVHFGVV